VSDVDDVLEFLDLLNGDVFFNSPGEMAGTVVYLASRAGEYTNGQELVVDGGYIAVNPAVC
jgi:NAD(P)-dependent dehydrogenase (short-subunit alcohol dehydrogenase family)